ATGALHAEVRLRFTGQLGAEERRRHRGLDMVAYRNRIERWVASGVTGAVVEDVTAGDEADGAFSLHVSFHSRAGAQRIQDGLLAFRPALLARFGAQQFTSATRRLPIVFGGSRWTDTVTVHLPEHFGAEDLGAPFAAEEDFGACSARTDVNGSTL